MTKTYNFEIEITTTEDVSDKKVEMTVAQFVGHLSGNQNVLTTNVDMDRRKALPEIEMHSDERERLLRLINNVDKEKKDAAMQIAMALSDSDNK